VETMKQESMLYNRWELKYVMTIKQMYALSDALKNFVVLDENGNDGIYKISSLYYDTHDFLFYHEKLDGQKHRQKVRLRGYGDINKSDDVFFEIKQRYDSTVQKRRVKMKLDDAYLLFDADFDAKERGYDVKSRQCIDEINYLSALYSLEPKLVVSYDRKAFMGKYEDGLRITFDTNMKCEGNHPILERKGEKQYFVHPSLAVLEIKTTEKVPIWLVKMIERFELEAHRVSKYCLSVDTLFKF
jgi:SPX domain protein involved in polyphosphate accumulation